MSERARLAALLARYAYKEGDFVLSSGARSTFYLDAKQVTQRPEGVALVGAAVLRIARELGVECVGGLTMGADAIVTAAVAAAGAAGAPLTGFVVRKEPKQHGLQKLIEGVSPEGKTVAIVEDVVTSGASALRAAEAVRGAGGLVRVVIGLVDREDGGRANIEAGGLRFEALCTLSEIREAARRRG